ncbi:hypothetical protein Anas_04433 [Armadillidium nasatum]|uniref:Uncharacterized protein n=1 Tax=Armadillidium nasatum TaxID=96803 RepID=A0A5N5T5C1_9CRUS|nr:hypothetical protein Anas_04433 [Armadillidium nasatum]
MLRTYQKTKNKNNRCSMQESDVIIEDLEPPIIKPKRKAFLFAICSFPDFSYGRNPLMQWYYFISNPKFKTRL